MGTDSQDVWAVSPVLSYLGKMGHPNDNDGVEMLSSLVIKDIFPKDLNRISSDFLITQKYLRKDARKELKNKVTYLVDRLKNV